jgi:hypothetical protein
MLVKLSIFCLHPAVLSSQRETSLLRKTAATTVLRHCSCNLNAHAHDRLYYHPGDSHIKGSKVHNTELKNNDCHK